MSKKPRKKTVVKPAEDPVLEAESPEDTLLPVDAEVTKATEIPEGKARLTWTSYEGEEHILFVDVHGVEGEVKRQLQHAKTLSVEKP